MTLSILLLVAGVYLLSMPMLYEPPDEGWPIAIAAAGALLLGPTLFLFGVARLMGWAT